MRDLLAGMAVTAAAGLLMGSAMRPDLDEGALPAPQLFTTISAAHPDEGATLAAYGGRVPDYVYGADWKQQTSLPLEAAPTEILVYDAPAPPEPEPVIRLTLDGLPVEPVDYPSLNGGWVYPTG